MSAVIKPGDRVSIAYSATVTGFRSGGLIRVRDDRGEEFIVSRANTTKLPEPEPTWKPGDVIRFLYQNGCGDERWIAALCTDGGTWVDTDRDHHEADAISFMWRVGHVEIAHRAAS